MRLTASRTIVASVVLALIGSVFTITPALAWHVNVEGCEVDPIPTLKATRYGPFLDPFHRFTVKHTGYRKTPPACYGLVKVPDRNWAQGTVFTLDQTGQTARRGESIRVRLGGPAGERCYTGSWSNSNEVERFCLTKRVAFVKSTTVKIRIIGRNGPRHIKRTLPYPGCVWKTPLLYSKPNTLQIVRRTAPISQVIAKWNSGREGYYRQPWRGYQTATWRTGTHGQPHVVCPPEPISPA